MRKEIKRILKLLGYKRNPHIQSEWIKMYRVDGKYWESYYHIGDPRRPLYFCPDGDLSQIQWITSIDNFFSTNPYLKQDWREYKINFLLSGDIIKKSMKNGITALCIKN